MTMRFSYVKDVIFLLLVSLVLSSSDPPKDIKEKLKAALQVTERSMDQLFARWQVKEYPNFLRAATMTHISYEVLKTKYQVKILKALAAVSDKEKAANKMVISFLGSSVTAGHDTQFNITTSELTRDLMKPAFDSLGINFQVINGALGNNPCLPYDICVKAFAGLEADIIQWEQVFSRFLFFRFVSSMKL